MYGSTAFRPTGAGSANLTGQVDFLRGAVRSESGVPIIALPSTAEDGAIYRIVIALKPGAGVMTSLGDVHYVITEHGAAYLHGKTLRQRVETLIGAANRTMLWSAAIPVRPPSSWTSMYLRMSTTRPQCVP
jgi:hypothetical protein